MKYNLEKKNILKSNEKEEKKKQRENQVNESINIPIHRIDMSMYQCINMSICQ